MGGESDSWEMRVYERSDYWDEGVWAIYRCVCDMMAGDGTIVKVNGHWIGYIKHPHIFVEKHAGGAEKAGDKQHSIGQWREDRLLWGSSRDKEEMELETKTQAPAHRWAPVGWVET